MYKSREILIPVFLPQVSIWNSGNHGWNETSRHSDIDANEDKFGSKDYGYSHSVAILAQLNNLAPLQLMWQWKWTNQIFSVLDHYYIIMLRESYQEKACELIFQFYMRQLPFRDFQLKDRKKYLPKATDKIYTFIFLIIIIILK